MGAAILRNNSDLVLTVLITLARLIIITNRKHIAKEKQFVMPWINTLKNRGGEG